MYKRIFNIVELIVKEHWHPLSQKEKSDLDKWIGESKDNSAIYKEVTNPQNIDLRFSLYNRIDHHKSWTDLQKRINRKSRKILLRNIGRWAAILILPLVLGYLVINHYNTNKFQQFIDRNVDFESKAVLILDDGKKIDLEKQKTTDLELYEQVTTRNSDNQLTYHISDNKKPPIQLEEIMNTVRTSVNINGDYSIILSDGTKVLLNNESQFKYPIQFIGKERKVYLSGEALFEVAENKEKPFVVVTDDMNIEVLGTVFNVKTDKLNDITQTTLINGSVGIKTTNNITMLSPGQQAHLEVGKELEVRDVSTFYFTAWTKGIYVFNDMEMLEILDLIQKWYNVEIFYESELSKHIRFTGAMDKNKPIDHFIALIEKTSSVKFFIAENALVIGEQ